MDQQIEMVEDQNARNAILRDICLVCKKQLSQVELDEKFYTKYKVSRPLMIPDANGVDQLYRFTTIQFKCYECQ